MTELSSSERDYLACKPEKYSLSGPLQKSLQPRCKWLWLLIFPAPFGGRRDKNWWPRMSEKGTEGLREEMTHMFPPGPFQWHPTCSPMLQPCPRLRTPSLIHFPSCN